MTRNVPPDTRDIGTCRKCRKSVRWVELTTGRKIPCELDPGEGALVAHYDQGRGMWTRAWFGTQAEIDAFLTVAGSAEWRRYRPHRH